MGRSTWSRDISTACSRRGRWHPPNPAEGRFRSFLRADCGFSLHRIDGEIARGGMGSVLEGRDPDLGRDVALKVLREDFRDNVDMVRRFVEEAQIGGHLPHPGTVPIYEMGTFADAASRPALRPFHASRWQVTRFLPASLER